MVSAKKIFIQFKIAIFNVVLPIFHTKSQDSDRINSKKNYMYFSLKVDLKILIITSNTILEKKIKLKKLFFLPGPLKNLKSHSSFIPENNQIIAAKL